MHEKNPAAQVWIVLIRHFFGRFFDAESLSPQGNPAVNITQALAFLATPGLFFIMLCVPFSVAGWTLVSARSLFVVFSMIVMGAIVIFEWDALFLDKRDYQILMPLPVPLWQLFVAKGIALGMFLALFLIAVNLFSTVFWQIVDQGNDLPLLIGTHLLVVTLAGLFAALSAAALQGVLMMVLPAKLLRPVSLAIQTMLIAGLILLFFVSPFVAGALQVLLRNRSELARYVPPFWFAGFYERLRPAVGAPALIALGKYALPGLGYAALLLLLSHLPGYKRHARRAVESLQPKPFGPGRLRIAATAAFDRMLLSDPVQKAVFHFIGQTIARSMKHRLFLACWTGFGIALTLLSLGAEGGITGMALLRLPLIVSFVAISGLRAAFNFPSELRANWIFQMNDPADSRAHRIATRKWIFLCALLPLSLFYLPVELWFSAWPAALFHTAFALILAGLLTETMFFGFDKIPFTCAYFPGKINLVWLVILFIAGFTFYSSWMAKLEIRLLKSPAHALEFFIGGLVVCLCAVDVRRLWPGARSGTDYEGADDPVVRTLELTAR